MTKITKIEAHQYTFENQDMKGNRIYTPGSTLTIGSFAVRIMTDDGLAGEYCPGFGGPPHRVMPAGVIQHGRQDRAPVFTDAVSSVRALPINPPRR